MLSIMLDKVTGYFDRRALISAFLPSLIFWALVVIMYVILQVNWQSAVKVWDGLSITVQFLLFLAYFAWVTFWSFLTINFRTSISRLYEGYWSDKKPFDLWLNWRRAYWSKRWSELNEQDQQLKNQEEILLNEKYQYNRLRTSPPAQQRAEKKWYNRLMTFLTAEPTITQRTVNAGQVGQKLDEFLVKLEEKLNPTNITQQPTTQNSSITFRKLKEMLNKLLNKLKEMLDPLNSTASNSLSITDIQSLGQEARSWWKQSNLWRKEAAQNENSPWVERYARLETLIATLTDLVDQRLEEVRMRRQPFYRKLSLYYPSQPVSIMPTQLGNVLRAMDLHAWERYHLDSVLIWPRLQASLPDAFLTPLQDAKTSLDLMITLSAFMLLFGMPLAIWIAVKAAVFLPWGVPLVIAVIVLAFRRYLLFGLSILALILYFAVHHPALFVVWLHTLIIFLVGVSFLSWLCYQNAVQAAINYGEKIKAAFDLYRWKVLEDLHLQLPAGFEEERRIWDEVDTLLAHSDPPDSNYYRYAQPEKTVSKAKEST